MDKNLYIFLTFAVCGIGGTQIYIRNKLNYLRKRGWKICVVTTEPGESIIIPELEPYKSGIFNELTYNPYLFTSRQRNRILDRVTEYIRRFGDTSGKIVIESSYIGISPWGELLAERLSAKHFIFFIQEDYRFRVDTYRQFFSFKFDRGELAVNSHKALSTLFEGFRIVSDSKNYQLSPYCSNSVEDCPSKIDKDLPKADFYIGSFGRINKPFVLPMVDDLIKYAKKNPDKTYHLVLFGWTDNPMHLEYLDSRIKDVDNLSFLVTGPIYPIPRCDIKKMNVFISTAGAVWATFNEGQLTISIDDTDLKPIGIMGHTTMNSLHRDNEPIVELESLLDDILIDKKYLPEEKNISRAEEIYEPKFDMQMDFITRSSQLYQYYPIKKLKPRLLSKLFFGIRETLRKI